MILLKELLLTDFISHEKNKITFNGNDKFLVSGKSGSGKSTICESILWVLFGRGRSDNRSLVRKGTKNASVSLKLIDGQLETLITRAVSNTGKNTLTVTQNSGSKKQFIAINRIGLRDIQNWIETEFLHSSYELFTNSVAHPQDNENNFVKASASRRKDLLLEIVRAGNFDDLYEKTRKTINANDTENAVILSKIENLEITIKESEELASKLDEIKKEDAEISKQIETQSIVEKDLEKKIHSISGITQKIDDKQATGRVIENSIQTIDIQTQKDEETIKQYESLDIERAKQDIKEANLLQIEVKKIEQDLQDNAKKQMKLNAHLANKPTVSDRTNDIELINKRLIPLIQDSGKCPAGDNCPFVIPIKGQIVFLTEQISEKTTKSATEKTAFEQWSVVYASLVPATDTSELYITLQGLKDKIALLEQSKEILIKHEMFSKTLTEIKEREIQSKEEKNKLNAELILIIQEVSDIEKELKIYDTNTLNNELSKVRINLQSIGVIKAEISNRMFVSQEALTLVKSRGNEVKQLRKGMSEAKDEKECLELLKEALSPRGVKAVVVDYLIPILEERMNEILSQMSEFSIRLDTQQKKADDSGAKEGLFITITNDVGEELPLSNLSGGESIKISMAISEALASLMKQVGFRIIDEAVTSLDAESTESFVEVLLKLQEKFPQLLIISHLSEIQDLFEQRIKIVKINGISKIIR